MSTHSSNRPGGAWRRLFAAALLAGSLVLGAAEAPLRPTDLLCLVGGEDAATLFEEGRLEEQLLRQPGLSTLRVRGLAFEGDTVGEQFRPLNFPAWREQIRRAEATVVMAQFGKMEVVEKPFATEKFMADYLGLLAEIQPPSGRVILISPTPFQKPSPPIPDLTGHNADLADLTARLRGFASAKGWLFVDLFHPLLDQHDSTRDGIHLNESGQRRAAIEIVRQLGLEPQSEWNADLGRIIREKNQLWLLQHRPQNWAFLHGDRTEQPSSRDHLNPALRWFPKEMELYTPLIEAKEREIRSHLQSLPAQP